MSRSADSLHVGSFTPIDEEGIGELVSEFDVHDQGTVGEK
jgi:hypothetical protein